MKKRTSLDSNEDELIKHNTIMSNGLSPEEHSKETSPSSSSSSAPTIFYFICLNALSCGMEFCVSAGFAYIPPLLLKIGLSETHMTYLMGVGPFLALSVVPALGRYSDTYKSRYGKRKPFILALSLLVLLSLILIPFGEAFGNILGSKVIGITVTAVGIALLDFSSLCCLNPTEALVSDTVRGTSYTKLAFTVHSCMLSVGGCIGFLITSTDWSTGFLSLIFKNQEQIAFSVIFALLVIFLATTLIVAKEKVTTSKISTPRDVSLTRVTSDFGKCEVDFSENDKSLLSSPRGLMSGVNCTLLLRLIKNIWRLLFILLFAPWRVVTRVFYVPAVLKRLFFADYCSWAGILCLSMFYTDYIGQHVFLGDPNAKDGSLSRIKYDAGVRRGSWDLLLHNITALLYASFVQNIVIRKYGLFRAYLLGLITFTLCMFGILFSSNMFIISGFTALSGIGFAAITTVPNTLVTGYHADKSLYFYDVIEDSRERGLGSDIAVLNSAYFLAQITLAVFMGPIVEMSTSVVYYVIVAAGFGFGSCLLACRIVFSATTAKKLQGNL